MSENIIIVLFKICPHCKENKSIKEYYKQTSVCKSCKKLWYLKNKENVLKKEKNYRDKNKEKISKRKRIYNQLERVKNKKSSLSLKYYYKNKEKIFKYRREKYKKDPLFKLLHNTRRRIQKILNIKDIKKKNSTYELIGCTPNDLKIHLQSKFKEGMSWDNYGFKGWHIDHIKPCASFDLSDIEQQKQCFHYSNLQPLWWWENISKSDKII